MGYQVYPDQDARDRGVDRWAGYGVPAECDWPDCREEIDRGLGFKCEDHGSYRLMLNGVQIDYARFDDEPDAEEVWTEAGGCGLYFCEHHRYETGTHAGLAPKPDHPTWVRHMLTDESWAGWRADNAEKAAALRETLTSGEGE